MKKEGTRNEIIEEYNGRFVDSGYAVVYDHNNRLAYLGSDEDLCNDEDPSSILLLDDLTEARSAAADVYGSKVWFVELWEDCRGHFHIENEKIIEKGAA